MPPRRSRISTVITLLLVFVIAWLAFYPLDHRNAVKPHTWTIPPPGELVDVGGYHLHLHCQGAARDGLPAVIFEAGAGDTSQTWRRVQPALSAETLVCAYDRAGYGWSDPGPNLRTAKRMAAELHTLLANAGVPPPYVFVAHSFGSFPARRFAIDYPLETAGLVLVDPTDETVPFFLPVTTMLAIALRVDALRAAFDPQDNDRLRQPHSSVSAALSAELFALPVTIRQISVEPGELNNLPLVVISASLDPQKDRVTMGQRDVMTRWSKNSRFIHVESGHALHHEQPDVVVQAIRSLLEPFRAEPFTLQEDAFTGGLDEP